MSCLGFLMPQSERRYSNGDLQRPNEIDLVLVTLGHTVGYAFREALDSANDILGNLDYDEDLFNEPLREVLQAPNPWLPVREHLGDPIVFSAYLHTSGPDKHNG